MFQQIRLFILILLLNSTLVSAHYIMFGPTLNWKIGKSFFSNLSVGFEYSQWEELNEVLVGIDYAVEFNFSKNILRFYSEAQIGFGVAGLSAGPVLEISEIDGLNSGFQSTVWGGFFGLVDFRLRKMVDKKMVKSLGIMGKIPTHLHL